MQPIKNLSVSVRYEDSKVRKVRTITHVTVMLGDMPVAAATLGGKYSQSQALAEYKRLPKRFARLQGYDMARAMGLVA